MSAGIIKIDVREDIAKGREPLGKILAAADGLGQGETLLLIVPFEPVPLYSMLALRGFQHESRQSSSGDWEVLFNRANGHVFEEIDDFQLPPEGSEPVSLEVDARGLEPPQPLVRILEALADIGSGGEIRALTDRRPIHLYAQLEERGFTGTTEENPEGGFITYIRRS